MVVMSERTDQRSGSSGLVRSIATYPLRLGPSGDRLSWNGFGGLAVVSSLSSAGDALVAVALAGSIFFSVPLHAARGRTALGLLCTLLPFVVVAPFLGPLIDRVRGGQRFVIFIAAIGRVAAAVMMAAWIHNLLLFPAAFMFLVWSKTQAVARASLVPAVVPQEDLMRANARLAVGSSASSAIAAGVGALVYKLLGSDVALGMASVAFGLTAVLAIDLLPRSLPPATPADGVALPAGPGTLPGNVYRGGVAMAGMRGMAGFMTGLVVFAFRQQGAPLSWYGAIALAGVAGNLCGALAAPRARRLGPERRLVGGSSLLVGVTAVAVTQFPDVRRRPAALLLVVVIGLCASVAKTAFDAIVQREIPQNQRATLFARLEALFQLTWVLGALAPTLIPIALLPGFIVVAAVVLISGAVIYVGVPGTRHRGHAVREQHEGREWPAGESV
jgi:hypothetical protein